MESRIKRTQRDYTMAFKLAVVAQVEKGRTELQAGAVQYQGRSTVLCWLRKHGRLDWGTAASSSAMAIDKTSTPLTPEQQIKVLQVVSDAHSRLQTEEVVQAMKMALRARQIHQPLVHHSDRGLQYCSQAYQDLYRRHG